jgi:hypothetical protein
MSSLGLGLPRPYHRTLFCILLLLILMTTPAEATIIVNQNDPNCSATKCGQVQVSPGRFDLNLGADFPNFNSVKLSYPKSSILTNSTGDLLFTVNLTADNTTADRTVVVVTNAGNLVVPNATVYSSVDIYIPPDFTGLAISNLWTSFSNDYNPNSLSLSRQGSTNQIAPGWWRVSVQHIILTNNLYFARTNDGMLVPNRIFVANQTQYVRLFQINSPLTAGRYFFKVFMNGTSVGSANFPTLVVKGSRDPAYISGTLRDEGNLNSTMTGKPINLPEGFGARILATGTDYLGRPATAQAFINSTAQGRYTIFGVAPGTYSIMAYAAGFVPTTYSLNDIAIRVNVLPAQSLIGIDIFLPRSVNVTGIVLSVDAEGNPVPWGSLFGFSGKTSRSIAISLQSVNGSQTASTPAPYRPTLFTNPDATSFPFTIHREVGYDGRIPQDFANYTSGLPSGDYYLRAYITSYLQFDDVYIHVSNDTLHTYSIIRLIRSGLFTVTVHFKDNNSSLTESPLTTGGTLSVSAYDQKGVLRGSNTTNVAAGSTRASLEIIGTSSTRGFGLTELLPASSGLYPGTYHILARLTSSPIFTGFANIGVRDTYYQLDEVQGTIGLGTPVSNVTLSLSMFKGGGILLTLHSVDAENPTVERLWTFPGAVMKFKIIDHLGNVFQVNSTQRADSSDLKLFFSGFLPNDYLIIAESLGYSQRAIAKIPIVLGGNSDAIVPMIQEPAIDLSLTFKTEHMFSPIDSTQPFAEPLNHIDATPVRIEVYDDLGNFVAASATYIPNLTSNGVPTTVARFLIAGFDYYFGDPKNTWAGFYDTTDASRQDEGGLVPGNYQILVWVDGYYQTQQIHVTLQSRQTASLVYSMERASRISGTILGPDMYEEARPLSWATITLQPENVSTTTFSLDGNYQLWTPSGSYKMGVSLAGYSTRTASLSVPAGSDLHLDFWLPDYGAQQAPSLFLYTSNITIAMANANTRTRAEGNSGIVWNAICAVAD